MVVKVDLYSIREGRESSLGTNAGKGGRGGGKFAGQKGKLGNMRRALNPIRLPQWLKKRFCKN